MDFIRTSSHVALLASLLFAINLGSSQDNRTPRTTFEQLYSASDLIARITITNVRYEHFDYQTEGGSTGKGLAKIYTFNVVDSIKSTDPDTPNEFVTAVGKNKDGSDSVWSKQAYFENGDELLVHLAQDAWLLGTLQPYAINPLGHHGSTFVIHETEQEIRVIPYLVRNNEPPAQAMRNYLHPDEPVISDDSNVVDYEELRDLYLKIGTEQQEEREAPNDSAQSENRSDSQVDFDPTTTFRDLFSRADLIARIIIKDQRYEEIKYLNNGRTREIIATINSFEIIDGFKVSSDLPNEFATIGGEYPDGTDVYATHVTYFEVGDDVLVHLKKNSLLFDRLDSLGVQPGGSGAASFAIVKSEQGLQLIPYWMKGSSREDLNVRHTLKAEGAVMSFDSPVMDYAELKNLYITLGEKTTADSQ